MKTAKVIQLRAQPQAIVALPAGKVRHRVYQQWRAHWRQEIADLGIEILADTNFNYFLHARMTEAETAQVAALPYVMQVSDEWNKVYMLPGQAIGQIIETAIEDAKPFGVKAILYHQVEGYTGATYDLEEVVLLMMAHDHDEAEKILRAYYDTWEPTLNSDGYYFRTRVYEVIDSYEAATGAGFTLGDDLVEAYSRMYTKRLKLENRPPVWTASVNDFSQSTILNN